MKTERRNRNGRNSGTLHELRVDEIMRRPTVDERTELRGSFGTEKVHTERKGIGKSGHVEMKNRIRVGRFNAVPAARGVRRTAD